MAVVGDAWYHAKWLLLPQSREVFSESCTRHVYDVVIHTVTVGVAYVRTHTTSHLYNIIYGLYVRTMEGQLSATSYAEIISYRETPSRVFLSAEEHSGDNCIYFYSRI